MIAGARWGKSTWLRRWLAMGMARDLRALVVPGLEVARARGLDLDAAGLRIAVTPRHANVLLLVGPIPAELMAAAPILYAQMMRPRAIFALGCGDLTPLPTADLSVELSQQHLLNGVSQLRKALARGAFQSDPADFNASILEARIEYTCSMHPEVVQDAPGSCPKCGMTLIPRESEPTRDSAHDQMSMNDEEGKHAAMSHDDKSDEDMDHGEMDHGEMDHGEMDHGEMDHGEMDHGEMDHGEMDHGEMDHSEMDHSEMGFMSMVEVTKDLPRSPDGLPMDWIEVPFGPVFPGLPGGLLLTLTLDGDTVAKAHARSLVGGEISMPAGGMEATRFVEHLGAMNPLTAVAYRLLACRALEAASEQTLDEAIVRGRVAALERERIASHLGWLAMLGRQTGFVWLEKHAARMQLDSLQADLPGMLRLRPAVHTLAQRLAYTPLLRARLLDIGLVSPDQSLRGPVARAVGMHTDARTADASYNALSFEVLTRQNGDAWDRLQIRLNEMQQSLALIQSAALFNASTSIAVGTASGDGQATLETPRGEARLHLTLDSGRVIQAHLDTPSTFLMSLLPTLLSQQELGDALTTVCSLDLSPWEVTA